MKKHLALTSCSDIREIMQPKLDQHGMTVFNYYRVYFNSRMLRLSSEEVWTEHYFKKNYMNNTSVPKSYLEKPLNHYLWLTEDCPEMLQDAALNFNISNGITIAKKHAEYVEYFCFATTTKNTRIVNHFYLGNLDKLQQYGLYFKEKAKSILIKAVQNPLILLNEKICNTDCQPKGKFKDSFIKLTNRQTECAQLLLRGMKYKEIASELKLSERTIEFYINNLRDKLKCQNKTELILKLNGIITNF